jgi:hypothetical protein
MDLLALPRRPTSNGESLVSYFWKLTMKSKPKAAP